MMNHSLKSLSNFPPGTKIIGKWHQHRYTLLKELGSGANGIVYLADWNGQKVALKMSDNSVSITSEVNVLKSFSKVQGYALGPSLIDVDDWNGGRNLIPFYAMEYIEGLNFIQFIQRKGSAWIPVLMIQLLKDLHELHRQGWVFGDIKPENLIVSSHPPRIRCIDVGGTTLNGRAIKEFTEFFDRGYWGLGSRKAEPSYDLFAVAMVMINAVYPKRFEKNNSGIKQLKDAILEKKELFPYRNVLLNALSGNYHSALEMRSELLHCLNEKTSSGTTINSRSQKRNKSVIKKQKHSTVTNKKKKSAWVETVLIVIIISLLYTLYILEQMN